MDHATSSRLLLATHFATSLLPLTTRLVPAITEIGCLIVAFRRADPTPPACHRFETRLQESLRELGRIIVEWTFNHLEPHDRKDVPGQLESGGTWYRRRSKTPNRSVATLFGTITLWRMLYQDIHGVEPSIFPLEVRLGLESGRATPALAERAARAAVTSPQGAVLATLHHVMRCGGQLRDLAGGDRRSGRRDGRSPPRHPSGPAAHLAAGAGRSVLGQPQAGPGRGARRADVADPWPGVLPRRGHSDGVGLRPGGGQRLGTVYLGRMPEPGQESLSRQLTALIEAVLRGWAGPSPRLAYITDGGYHQTRYYRRVLRRMSDPRHPGRRLEWHWVIDYYQRL